jgi:hypothetical protein
MFVENEKYTLDVLGLNHYNILGLSLQKIAAAPLNFPMATLRRESDNAQSGFNHSLEKRRKASLTTSFNQANLNQNLDTWRNGSNVRIASIQSGGLQGRLFIQTNASIQPFAVQSNSLIDDGLAFRFPNVNNAFIANQTANSLTLNSQIRAYTFVIKTPANVPNLQVIFNENTSPFTPANSLFACVLTTTFTLSFTIRRSNADNPPFSFQTPTSLLPNTTYVITTIANHLTGTLEIYVNGNLFASTNALPTGAILDNSFAGIGSMQNGVLAPFLGDYYEFYQFSELLPDRRLDTYLMQKYGIS